MITRLSSVFIVLLSLMALVDAGVPVAVREAIDIDERNIIGRDEDYEVGYLWQKPIEWGLRNYKRLWLDVDEECARHDDKVDLRQSANAVFQWQLHAGRHAGGADRSAILNALQVPGTGSAIIMTVWPDFPTVCATLGYDTTTTLLLCAPPWAFATIVAFALTWYSDKKQRRYKYFAASNALGALSCIRHINLYDEQGGGGVYGVNNTFAREPAKRAVAIALINTIGQIGNIVGPYAWPSKWGQHIVIPMPSASQQLGFPQPCSVRCIFI
ncbi:hypothetical protein EV424DRAFT_1352173 [Suillus variegatus]|nr:hypothetical protein EV424DRAFT_1352173 [Suillus variegatus]